MLIQKIARIVIGSLPEWLMGADCKSAGTSYAGSNPARPKIKSKEKKGFEPSV